MSGKVVLAVDDNPTNLKLVRVVLHAAGYTVHTATDASEALASVQATSPDLILMDLQMPGMDGLTLTRQLKTDPGTQGIRIVALTAYAMKGDEQRAMAAGCDGYIAKPVDTDVLVALVAQHLAETPPHVARPGIRQSKE